MHVIPRSVLIKCVLLINSVCDVIHSGQLSELSVNCRDCMVFGQKTDHNKLWKFRLVDASVAKFESVKDDYRHAGCCVKAAQDLRNWALTTFGANLQCKDVHIIFMLNGNPIKSPISYAKPCQGKMSPDMTTIHAARMFKLRPGTCIWSFDTKIDKTVERLAYKHSVVQIDDMFMDWGFDQFLLPEGIEMVMVV